jgi:hypothetical protein
MLVVTYAAQKDPTVNMYIAKSLACSLTGAGTNAIPSGMTGRCLESELGEEMLCEMLKEEMRLFQ